MTRNRHQADIDDIIASAIHDIEGCVECGLIPSKTSPRASSDTQAEESASAGENATTCQQLNGYSSTVVQRCDAYPTQRPGRPTYTRSCIPIVLPASALSHPLLITSRHLTPQETTYDTPEQQPDATAQDNASDEDDARTTTHSGKREF